MVHSLSLDHVCQNDRQERSADDKRAWNFSRTLMNRPPSKPLIPRRTRPIYTSSCNPSDGVPGVGAYRTRYGVGYDSDGCAGANEGREIRFIAGINELPQGFESNAVAVHHSEDHALSEAPARVPDLGLCEAP